VLDLLADGESTRDISGRLVLSELTVHSHIKSILRKLGVHSRAEAVARLRELRTEPDDEAS
jgi:DNA-binding NarL/FixJ family response regulator